MHIGLIIYGSLATLTGGYIYDRILVDYMRQRGHQVEIISLPRRNYGIHLLDNLTRRLHMDSATLRFDLLLQDKLYQSCRHVRHAIGNNMHRCADFHRDIKIQYR